MEQSPLEIRHLVKKLPTSYGTQTFITGSEWPITWTDAEWNESSPRFADQFVQDLS
jgi:hypothetical protein